MRILHHLYIYFFIPLNVYQTIMFRGLPTCKANKQQSSISKHLSAFAERVTCEIAQSNDYGIKCNKIFYESTVIICVIYNAIHRNVWMMDIARHFYVCWNHLLISQSFE